MFALWESRFQYELIPTSALLSLSLQMGLPDHAQLVEYSSTVGVMLLPERFGLTKVVVWYEVCAGSPASHPLKTAKRNNFNAGKAVPEKHRRPLTAIKPQTSMCA